MNTFILYRSIGDGYGHVFDQGPVAVFLDEKRADEHKAEAEAKADGYYYEILTAPLIMGEVHDGE